MCWDFLFKRRQVPPPPVPHPLQAPQTLYGSSNDLNQPYQLHVPQQQPSYAGHNSASYSYQNQIIQSALKPLDINEDLDDMSPGYTKEIIDTNPEHILIPVELLEQKYDDIECSICGDVLKVKTRPVALLSCGHYLHYVCYRILLESDAKKKRMEYLFNEIKKTEEVFMVKCPLCRNISFIQGIYIKMPMQTIYRPVSEVSIILTDSDENEEDHQSDSGKSQLDNWTDSD